MKELKDITALELGKLVNSKEVSPTEVLDYFFNRIESHRDLNAFTYLKKEEAYTRAKELEAVLATDAKVGVFAGVPFALKDFLPSKMGWYNTHGGVECLTATDKFNSEFCTAMESAGGIAIGKTNAPAFGFRGTTDNRLYGPTHNPHNYMRNAGGSSGGSAAAVAAGLVPIAEGGDAGGSIRIPAAWCGCYGYKSSFGLIPNINRPDAWAATHPYCTPGGLTKNVEDAAVLNFQMSRYDYRDPLSYQGFKRTFNANFRLDPNDLSDLKVLVTSDFGGLFGSVDPEIQEALDRAAAALESVGAKIYRADDILKLPYDLKFLADLWCKHISVDSMLEFEKAKVDYGFDLLFEAGDHLPKEFGYWYERAKELTVFDFYIFNQVRTKLYDVFTSTFREYDIVLSPVTVCLPVENSREKGETKGPNGTLIEFAETFLYNFTGNPAASCPMGFSKDGLPLAVQVAAGMYDDNEVLRVSRFLEEFNNSK